MKINRALYWTPRLLSVIFILFLSLFSLDVFDSAYSIKEILIGLFMHNIPSLVLLIILIISWKKEIVGAIIFSLAGLLYTIKSTIGMWPHWYIALSWSMIIAGPAIIIGIMFYLNWKKRKDKNL